MRHGPGARREPALADPAASAAARGGNGSPAPPLENPTPLGGGAAHGAMRRAGTTMTSGRRRGRRPRGPGHGRGKGRLRPRQPRRSPISLPRTLPLPLPLPRPLPQPLPWPRPLPLHRHPRPRPPPLWPPGARDCAQPAHRGGTGCTPPGARGAGPVLWRSPAEDGLRSCRLSPHAPQERTPLVFTSQGSRRAIRSSLRLGSAWKPGRVSRTERAPAQFSGRCFGPVAGALRLRGGPSIATVSYTHLTLPTILRV